MERQALRRVEQGSLTDDQVEKGGSTLMALEARMAELRDHFGLTVEDLNLDLGPQNAQYEQPTASVRSAVSRIIPAGRPDAPWACLHGKPAAAPRPGDVDVLGHSPSIYVTERSRGRF